MSLSSIGSAPGALSSYELNALQSTSGVAQLSSTTGTSPSTGAVGGVDSDGDHDGSSAKISQAGQLLSKLQELKTKDPAQFKQVLSDIASQLQTLAQQQGQGPGTQWLTQLANNFKTAASTGDLSALQPHGHRHHSGGAAGTYTRTGASDQSPLQQASGAAGGSSASTSLQSQLASIFGEVDTALGQ